MTRDPLVSDAAGRRLAAASASGPGTVGAVADPSDTAPDAPTPRSPISVRINPPSRPAPTSNPTMRSAFSPRAVSMSTGSLREPGQPAADREPIEARQHQIEHDEVGALGLGELTRPDAVAGLERPEAVAPQVADHDLPHDRSSSTIRTVCTGAIVTPRDFQSLKSASVTNRSAARKEPERPRP